MPLDETTEAELLAYAYGELSAPAARAFEQRLQADAELQAELAGVMATRELFGRDARWGMDSKVDVPPPHLVDAIVRAEALARPAAIRDARALAPRPTLTARLSRWLIGGGVLVGATAALVVVVTQADRSAEPAALALDGDGVAALASPPEPPPPPPADAPAADPLAKEAAAARLGDNEGREESLRATAAKREPLPDAFDSLARADAKAKPTEVDEDRATKGDLATGDRGGIELGLVAPTGGSAAGPGKGGGLFGAAQPAASPTTPPPLIESLVTEKARAATASAADESLALDDVGTGTRSSSVVKPNAVAPAPTAAAPVSTPTPRKDVAPSAPPNEAPALAQRPSTGALEVLSPAEAKAERRRLADERAKRKKPTAKAGEHARDGEAAGAKSDAKKTADKAPPPPGPDERRAMQRELALMSGYRELKEGRALSALSEFESAERLDARRALGSDPHVGQMRALVALKRPAEALVIARRLVTRDVNELGVADGLALGAKLAEDLGDLRSARELWTALVKSPAHKVAAQQALARLANPPVRAQLDAAEAAPAAEAATEPASKE